MADLTNIAAMPRSLPRHIAIIMDGNGRWAKARGLPRIAGHRSGAEAVRRTVTAAGDMGIPYLTLFGFSSENWKRPSAEVQDLMVLLRHGWRMAAWVSVLRVVAGSMLLGSFLSPGFVLSAGGALASIAALSLTIRLPPPWFGPVTHSVVAAFAHIAMQLAIVYFWLIPHAALLRLSPLFALAALVFGSVNGVVAARLLAGDAPPGAMTGTGDPRTILR